MAVFERIKEFGVLKALGISPEGVLKLIYVESMLQVVLAVGIGVTLALPAFWYLTRFGIDMGALAGTEVMGMVFMETWYAVVSPQVFVQPILMMVFVVSLAVLYPAAKAARIRPVDAMRHQ
jgi:ABC-type antimicrobial peptide transport system permease subunit